ncbi:nuclear transport factor 2 family protein [Aquirufa nivalisilvae]|uniref:nuclear transport factor 2 family protein n=1 Tax=Aquirufa nivalisilvae TaxID=2516557 RepID=UPI0022A92854|nr:nuclear transport factor 2 family protein [Aquirufa nivalisilvae]MCZ2480401.1 nuclear transport factor 2 family protein [Aquirufa nivalisilvae]
MKQIFALLVVSLFFVSCQSSSSNIEEKNKELIEKYFTLFNQHDWKALSEMYVDSAAFKDPTSGMKVIRKTKAQFVQEYTGLQQQFPDVHDQVLSIYPSGEKHVTVEFVSTGTRADQKKFELPIVVIFRIENGKIVQDFTYYVNL